MDKGPLYYTGLLACQVWYIPRSCLETSNHTVDAILINPSLLVAFLSKSDDSPLNPATPPPTNGLGLMKMGSTLVSWCVGVTLLKLQPRCSGSKWGSSSATRADNSSEGPVEVPHPTPPPPDFYGEARPPFCWRITKRDADLVEDLEPDAD